MSTPVVSSCILPVEADAIKVIIVHDRDKRSREVGLGGLKRVSDEKHWLLDQGPAANGDEDF